MHFRTTLFIILCLTLPEWSVQQYRVGMNNSKYSAAEGGVLRTIRDMGAVMTSLPLGSVWRTGVPTNSVQHGSTRIYMPKEPSNWKAILIIAVSVLFVATIIYGSNCFYVCKMHFFERTEKKYTKMDSCVPV